MPPIAEKGREINYEKEQESDIKSDALRNARVV